MIQINIESGAYMIDFHSINDRIIKKELNTSAPVKLKFNRQLRGPPMKIFKSRLVSVIIQKIPKYEYEYLLNFNLVKMFL